MLLNTDVSTTDYEISQSHNNVYKMVSRDLEVVKTYYLELHQHLLWRTKKNNKNMSQ
jgi:hypothetical protein